MSDIKLFNNIAPIGLEIFTKNNFKFSEKMDSSQAKGIVLRSHKLATQEIGENILGIARAGAGYNNIPVDECSKRGIVVFNTPGANANAVKELVIASLIIASRNIIAAHKTLLEHVDDPEVHVKAEKIKKQFAGLEIQGKTIGVIGLGAIGLKVARAAIALGLNVVGYDPYLKDKTNAPHGLTVFETVDEMAVGCDYITVHVPFVKETEGIVNKNLLAKMNKGGIVVNFSRDGIVDDQAIQSAITNGQIHKYITDFATPDLLKNENVIVLPHLGASTAEAENNCAIMACQQMVQLIQDGNIVNSVNYPECVVERQPNVKMRVAIHHGNISNTLNTFTNIISKTLNINILNMINKSRGELAYTIIDLEDAIGKDIVKELKEVNGVLKVRLL